MLRRRKHQGSLAAGGWRPRGVVWIPVLLVVCGCGRRDQAPPVAPVQGRVLRHGEPVEGAVVSFYREGAPRIATGKTAEGGAFTLSTYAEGDGAYVGTNKVAVYKPAETPLDDAPPPNPETMTPEELRAAQFADHARVRQRARDEQSATPLLPRHYSDPDRSGLVFDVQAGRENSFDIMLTE